MAEVIIAVVIIDNDDDGLPPDQWRDLMRNVGSVISMTCIGDPMQMYSSPAPQAAMERRALWMMTITPEAAVIAQTRLLRLAGVYGRSISWSEISGIRLLTPVPEAA
jgi:hypothetical protein